jgi:hypothetical protein
LAFPVVLVQLDFRELFFVVFFLLFAAAFFPAFLPPFFPPFFEALRLTFFPLPEPLFLLVSSMW